MRGPPAGDGVCVIVHDGAIACGQGVDGQADGLLVLVDQLSRQFDREYPVERADICATMPAYFCPAFESAGPRPACANAL